MIGLCRLSTVNETSPMLLIVVDDFRMRPVLLPARQKSMTELWGSKEALAFVLGLAACWM